MKRRLALGLAATAMLLAASPADAATVGLAPTTPGEEAAALAFIAAPGERNEVALRVAVDTAEPFSAVWTVTDTGAVLVPGESCEALDAHTVRCVTRTSARVDVGDMDDRFEVGDTGVLRVFAHGGAGHDELVAANVLSAGSGVTGHLLDGGPGNDRLRSGNGNDTLHGGGGADEVDGGPGQDALFDDDMDGAAGDAGPGPDRFDGGMGVDSVNYHRRTAPVVVDLTEPLSAGRAVKATVW